MYDLIIIGAGPAGLTAGIYALRSGLKVLIIEKDSVGGQIASSPVVQNYPGYKEISGAELANNLFDQVMDLGCDFEIDDIKKIEPGDVCKVIGDETYEAKSIIIATGAKHRLLNLDNEIDLIGKRVHFCTSCDGAFYKGKTTAVVGGGNTAITNAMYLSDLCKKVYLIVRKDYLRAEQTLQDELSKYKNIEVLYKTNIVSYLKEDDHKIIINKDGKEEELEVDGIFLSIGLDANTSLVKDLLDLNDTNYIVSNDSTTKYDNIFVAGDCRDKKIRQLTTATSDGTYAAVMAIDYLKRSK